MYIPEFFHAVSSARTVFVNLPSCATVICPMCAISLSSVIICNEIGNPTIMVVTCPEITMVSPSS